MSFENVIRGNSMKIHVITLRRKKTESGDFEEVEKYAPINKRDVACLYKDRKGVFILRRDGILVKVKHSLEEMEGYFFGGLIPNERAY